MEWFILGDEDYSKSETRGFCGGPAGFAHKRASIRVINLWAGRSETGRSLLRKPQPGGAKGNRLREAVSPSTHAGRVGNAALRRAPPLLP